MKNLNVFFINPYIYEKYDTRINDNRILKIIKNKNLNKKEKFVKLINSLYLSHLLDFVLTYKQFYSNAEVLQSFYNLKPRNKEEFKLLRKYKALINNLRNDIMHFNFENYEINKNNYLEALNLFEKHIGCSSLVKG